MTSFLLYDPRTSIQQTLDHLKEQGVKYVVMAGSIDGESTIASINKSHKNLIRLAQGAGWPTVTVLESDVWFPHPKGWQRYFDFLYDSGDYDIYLGGVYGLNESAKKRLVNGLCEVNNFQGFHCYTVNARFYEKFLSVPDDQHIDVVMAGLGVFKVLYPFVALQRPGYSANARGFVDYNKTLNPEDIYQ